MPGVIFCTLPSDTFFGSVTRSDEYKCIIFFAFLVNDISTYPSNVYVGDDKTFGITLLDPPPLSATLSRTATRSDRLVGLESLVRSIGSVYL